MNTIKKTLISLATLAVAAVSGAQTVDNWRSADGLSWKNGTSELCWRNTNWTPATAAADCDGAIVSKPAPTAPTYEPRRSSVAPAAAPQASAPVAVATAVSNDKVSYAVTTLFDFDKAVLKPQGKAALNDLLAKTKGINMEVAIAIGHTDSVGSASYNDTLSKRRAGAVRAYLISKGIDASKIYTEGKGLTQPAADNKTRQGRAQNRRVEVEIVSARGQ